MILYFAGGMYHPTEKIDNKVRVIESMPRTFGIVHSCDENKPYITRRENGLKLTAHHASLYSYDTATGFAKMVEVRAGDSMNNPRTIKLTSNQQLAIQNSINLDYWFD